MAIDRNLVQGSMAMMILRLLETKDMYGYEMIEALRERSNNVFELKADDGSDLSCRFLTMSRQFLNKSLTALRVRITTVHEAMDECIVDIIFLSDIAKLEKMNQ